MIYAATGRSVYLGIGLAAGAAAGFVAVIQLGAREVGFAMLFIALLLLSLDSRALRLATPAAAVPWRPAPRMI